MKLQNKYLFENTSAVAGVQTVCIVQRDLCPDEGIKKNHPEDGLTE